MHKEILKHYFLICSLYVHISRDLHNVKQENKKTKNYIPNFQYGVANV